ncbi:uncharacterized protein [Ptychodera flava]|uniref:uncharacterized protein n=1 Tax=Ptychodera flava TaxID=63121 RepID=UPI003969BEFA
MESVMAASQGSEVKIRELTGQPAKGKGKVRRDTVNKNTNRKTLELSQNDKGKSRSVKNTGEEKPYSCHVCWKKLSSKLTLRKHMVVSHPEVRYSCTVCGEKFTRDRFRRNHERIHRDSPQPTCQYCGKSFKTKKGVKSHIKMIHKQEFTLFSCNICGKQFKFKHHLKRHMFVHKEKSVTCQQCGRKYKSPFSLSMHMATHTEFKPFTCKYCGQKFRHEGSQIVHEMMHNKLDGDFLCTICDRQYGCVGSFKQHVRTHLKKKVWACDICGKTFARLKHVYTHKRAEHDVEPHTCQVCGKSFCSHSSLQRHAYGMHVLKGRTYRCKYCEEEFTAMGSLEEHYSSYHGEKSPFQCEYCGRTFKSTSGYLPHRKQHLEANETGFKCKICGKKYFQQHFFCKHMGKHERDTKVGGEETEGSANSQGTNYSWLHEKQSERNFDSSSDQMADLCMEKHTENSDESKIMTPDTVVLKSMINISTNAESNAKRKNMCHGDYTKRETTPRRPILEQMMEKLVSQTEMTVSHGWDDSDLSQLEKGVEGDMPSCQDGNTNSQTDTRNARIKGTVQMEVSSEHMTTINNGQSIEEPDSSVTDIFPEQNGSDVDGSCSGWNGSSNAQLYSNTAGYFSSTQDDALSRTTFPCPRGNNKTNQEIIVTSTSQNHTESFAAVKGTFPNQHNVGTQVNPDELGISTCNDTEVSKIKEGTLCGKNDNINTQLVSETVCTTSQHDTESTISTNTDQIVDKDIETSDLPQGESDSDDDTIVEAMTPQGLSSSDEDVHMELSSSDEETGHTTDSTSVRSFSERPSRHDKNAHDHDSTHMRMTQNADLLVDVEFEDSDAAEDDGIILTFRCNSPDRRICLDHPKVAREEELKNSVRGINAKRASFKRTKTRISRNSNNGKDSSVECIILDSDDDFTSGNSDHPKSLGYSVGGNKSAYFTDRREKRRQPIVTNDSRSTTSEDEVTSRQDGDAFNSDTIVEQNSNNTNKTNKNVDKTCENCSIDYPSLLLYLLHRGFHGPNGAFHCSVCGEMFQDSVNFNIHIIGHPLHNLAD